MNKQSNDPHNDRHCQSVLTGGTKPCLRLVLSLVVPVKLSPP